MLVMVTGGTEPARLGVPCGVKAGDCVHRSDR